MKQQKKVLKTQETEAKSVGFTIPGTPVYGIIILRDNFPGKNRFRR